MAYNSRVEGAIPQERFYFSHAGPFRRCAFDNRAFGKGLRLYRITMSNIRKPRKALCRKCQQEFTHFTGNKRQYCNHACAMQARKVVSQYKCEFCGDHFHRRGSGHKYRFCSAACRQRAKADPTKQVARNCATCGNKFSTWAYRQQRYCNPKCNPQRIFRGHPSAAEKDRGRNWKMQSAAARKRDHYRCQSCGVHALIVHHKRPYRTFKGNWKLANRLSNLITLCRSCHPRVEFGSIPCPKPRR